MKIIKISIKYLELWSTARKIISLTIVLSFIVGFANVLCSAISNRYLFYKLYRLILLDLQYFLNKWILACILFLVLIYAFITIFQKILRFSDRTIIAFIISFIFFAYFICWINVNFYYSTFKYELLRILGCILAFFIALFLGLLIYRIGFGLDKLYAYVKKLTNILFISKYYNLITKSSLFIIIFMFILNLSVPIDSKINKPKGPNVILISIDTLRADHLGCYGYKRDTSPNIDKFAKESVLFKNSRSQSHWTCPSHLSLLTSLFPSVFKVWEWPNPGRLSNKYLTLAEILKNEGYKTAAFTEGVVVSEKYGFKQGFDEFYEPLHASAEGDIRNTFNRYAIEWINRKKKDKMFIFLHCYDVHLPYDPPEPFKSRFSSQFTPANKLADLHSLRHVFLNNDSMRFLGNKAKKDPNFLSTMIALYDGEINNVDNELEKFFYKLKDMKLFDDTLIIFISDHGEQFNEHGSFGHCNLYDTELHTPLIIHLPKLLNHYNRQIINTIVGNIDLIPTILEILEINSTGKNIFQGFSFLNVMKRTVPFHRPFVFSESLNEESHICAVATDRFKYLFNAKGKEELYDVMSDPKEENNLLLVNKSGSNIRNVRDKFFKLLGNQIQSNEALSNHLNTGNRRNAMFDKDTFERLKSLGYVQ